MRWLQDYKDYWIPIIVTNLATGLLYFFTDAEQKNELINFFNVLAAAFIVNFAIAIVIFGISWFFRHGLTLFNFVRILAAWSYIHIAFNVLNLISDLF